MDSGFLTIPKPEGYVPHFGVLIFITSVVLFFVYAKQKKEWEKCINCVLGVVVGVVLFFSKEIGRYIVLSLNSI
jgi:hypothetical protein